METSEKTDSEKEDLLNRYIKYEVSNAAHKSKELPSLFSNFIKPWIKDLATATEYYGTLNDEQMQRRAQIA